MPAEAGMLQRKKASSPASVPFLTTAILKASWVEPGPGSALPSDSKSAKREEETQRNWSTNCLLCFEVSGSQD